MIFDWYKIFNITEFDLLGLFSKSYTYELQDIGLKTLLVCKGVRYSILVDDIFLVVNLNDKNPYYRDGWAVQRLDNGDVYLGKLVVNNDN